MRLLIGGGGTGGHVYPALALARYALDREETSDVLFVGSAEGLENRIVPAAGFRLATISARGFNRSFRQLGGTARAFFKGIVQCRRLIVSFRPSAVIGTGGFVAAPLVVAAITKRLPVIIHEQNARPGLANRVLAPFVGRVCVSFAETEKRFSRFSRVVFTGNPRASEVFVRSGRADGPVSGPDRKEKTVLVYGGSRGALRLNEVVAECLLENGFPKEVQVIFVTGRYYYEKFAGRLGSLGKKVRLLPYLEDMPAALCGADLVVTRSGATTLAEITVLGVPAILVPSPNVVDNHQYYNACLLADVGAAVLIEESDLDSSVLRREVEKILSDSALACAMGENSRKLGVADACERFYRCLGEVAS